MSILTRCALVGALTLSHALPSIAADDDFSEFNGRYKTRTSGKERKKASFSYGFSTFRVMPDGTVKARGMAYLQSRRQRFSGEGHLTVHSDSTVSLADGTMRFRKPNARGKLDLRTFSGQEGLVRGTMKLTSRGKTWKVFLVKGL